MQIPVYDNNYEIIAVENFKNNLDIIDAPSYTNEGCSMGLTRISKGEYKGYLALLYENEIHPNSSHGELISDHDAWELCYKRGKISLIEEFDIDWNVGLME